MKRTETIALHQEEFLANRTPEQREKFLNKSIEKQYASIKQWLMRNAEKQKNSRGRRVLTGTDVVNMNREAVGKISNGPTLTARELQKLRTILTQGIDALDNYDKILKQAAIEAKKRALAELDNDAARIANKKEEMARELQALESEIGE